MCIYKFYIIDKIAYEPILNVNASSKLKPVIHVWILQLIS